MENAVTRRSRAHEIKSPQMSEENFDKELSRITFYDYIIIMSQALIIVTDMK